MDSLERRIAKGTLTVDDEGNLVSVHRDEAGDIVTTTPIGHPGNKRAALYVKYKHEGEVKSVTANRLAWRIHHGFWPPDGLSVVVIDGQRGNFRKQNLILVPRGKEGAVRKAVADGSLSLEATT